MLSRRDLEEGRMREVYVEALAEGHALTDGEMSASLAQTLRTKPKGAGWWVFAYGSLLWNPLFPFAEARRASVHGLHRRFCLWSLASRGTPNAPGLVLGLDRGGSCRGVVYRLPPPCALEELRLLWRREMVTGAYAPRWLHVECEGRRIIALGFVVKRAHAQYAGHLTIQAQANVIAHACGAFGSSADYLERTRVSLATHGVIDIYLERLAARVGAKVGARAAD
ncbi:MAG TPA: gamma-glutamylcyclotransferase [Casimicrobiaceae bacterium]|nr:gamma-glutamylcyclotransferase [Casimicrobiaceae bacterium]